MRKNLLALLCAVSLMGCAPATNEDHHHVTSPTIAADQAAPAPYGGTILNADLPQEILQLSFTNQLNQKFTLKTYEGKTLVVTNFLTYGQDAAPLTATNFLALAQALQKSEAKQDVIFLLISVDSVRDTASRLKAYADVFEFPENVVLASSTSETLEKLWKFFGVPAAFHELSPDEIATFPNDWQTGLPPTRHYMLTNIVAVIDAHQTWRWMQSGNPNIEKNPIPQKMRDFLSPDGRALTKKNDDFSWRTGQVLSAISEVTGLKIS